jgi:hypothetical protein
MVLRSLRRAIAVALPVVGTIVVFAAILVPSISLDLQVQILVVLVGLLMVEAGVWKLTAKILPSERKFLALRAEVDSFIGLVRDLNTAAVELRSGETPEKSAAFQDSLASLHTSVDRMAEVAGKETEIT